MPLPKPSEGEKQDDFISRCMGNDTMKDEFPDNDQRLAVCYQRWRDKDKEKDSAEADELRYIIERRYVPALELRETEDKKQITGYAAVFNTWSEDLGFFREQIAPGAFAKTIKDGDIRALINHDPNLIIGRTKNDTLRLWEDEKGLGFEVDLPDTTYAHDLRESIRRKDITQNSFGFLVVKDEWNETSNRRTLREVKLFDISPVTFPAYKQTSVKLRLYELGIDYERLNAALVRTGRSVATEKDAETIRSAMNILGKYVPRPEEPPAAVGETSTSNVVAMTPTDDPGHSAETAEPAAIATLIRMQATLAGARKTLSRR